MTHVAHIGSGDLARLIGDRGARMPWDGHASHGVLVVDLDEGGRPGDLHRMAGPPAGFPAVVVGASRVTAWRPPWCDTVVDPEREDLELVARAVGEHPLASMALVELLRCSEGMSVDAGLLAESATYGALQAGSEFRRWREGRPRRPVPDTPDPVLVERCDDVLHLRLHRPERRNALDAAMRDALAEQLDLAVLDRTIEHVVIEAAGPDFCSGGDLDEFGTFEDASQAHLVRLERSLGRKLHRLADRTTVRLHGACIGSGIELAAFAGTVDAAPDVMIGLPEVSMGLIPGAGGTVSVTRRIGRHRTCWLALTGRRVDAMTALEWGLVDTVGPTDAG